MKRDIILIFICVLGFINIIIAQNVVLPIQHDYASQYERQLHRLNQNIHTGVKPLASKEVYYIVDSTQEQLRLDTEFSNSKLGDLVLNDCLFNVHEDNEYDITGNLLLGFHLGQASDTTYGSFIRGGRIEGSIGEKVYFSTDIYLGSSVFPDYLTDRNDDARIFNGNGAMRIYNASNGQRQQSTLNATGQVTVQPNKYFQFQLGQGKNFIGDGYRSMLLSDYATFYPYFKIQTSFWNIQYTNLYTSMIADRRKTNSLGIFPRKYMTAHHLSWNITPRINIGLFETVVYQDSSNTRGFDLHYLNPLIFYRPIEFEIGSRGGNALIGLNTKIKITNDLHFYGQFIIDELSFSKNRIQDGWWGNKYGWQVGFKSFNTFIPNLTIQSELNSATAYTYSHKEPLQNYANSRLALAHPLGANFIESMSIIRYQKNRITSRFQLMYALQGLDSNNSNWGVDINETYDTREQDYGNELLQGVRTTTTFADFAVGYIINPRSNFHIELGYRYRSLRPEVEVGYLQATTDSFVYIGFKTNFVNWYYDY